MMHGVVSSAQSQHRQSCLFPCRIRFGIAKRVNLMRIDLQMSKLWLHFNSNVLMHFFPPPQPWQDPRFPLEIEGVSHKGCKGTSVIWFPGQRRWGCLWDEVVVCIVLGSHQIWEMTIQPTVFLTATKASRWCDKRPPANLARRLWSPRWQRPSRPWREGPYMPVPTFRTLIISVCGCAVLKWTSSGAARVWNAHVPFLILLRFQCATSTFCIGMLLQGVAKLFTLK